MNFAFTKFDLNEFFNRFNFGWVGNSNGAGKLKRIKFSFLSLRFSHPWKRKYREKTPKSNINYLLMSKFPR